MTTGGEESPAAAAARRTADPKLDTRVVVGAYGIVVSPDGSHLAYSLDVTGFRQYSLFIKNLLTGEILPDRAEKTGSVVWAADGKTVFYTIEDAAKRHYRVYRHRLGETIDDLVREETDERFYVAVGRSRDRRYLFL